MSNHIHCETIVKKLGYRNPVNMDEPVWHNNWDEIGRASQLLWGNLHKEALILIADILLKPTSPAVPLRALVRGSYQENSNRWTKKKTELKIHTNQSNNSPTKNIRGCLLWRHIQRKSNRRTQQKMQLKTQPSKNLVVTIMKRKIFKNNIGTINADTP